jgi:hypothetical protein
VSVKHKPYSLAFNLETTRPGEQIHAEPDPLSEVCARRLRDIERAGSLRNRLYSADFGAAESAHFCRHSLHDPERAIPFERAAAFYGHLFDKACRLERRARGEASDV